MKKIVLAMVIALSPVIAEADAHNPFLHNEHFPDGYFLMPDSFPHFMGIYMKHGGMQKLNPTKEQKLVIEKQFVKIVPIIMKTATEIKTLETMIVSQVINDGKTAKDVSDALDKVANKRRELADLQIECLNVFKKTLTEEQYQLMIKLAAVSTHD